MLGPPRLVSPSGRVSPCERKTAALLAYLALEGPTPRLRMAGLLWPDTPASAARNNLVHVLGRARKQCGAELVGPGPDLRLHGVTCDAADLLRGEPVEEDGEFLAGVDLGDTPDLWDWLTATRERVETARTAAALGRIARLEQAGQVSEALALTLHFLTRDPLREDAWRTLMRLHVLNGDRAAALDAYRRCKEVLRRELGVSPSPDTRALAEAVDAGRLPSTPSRSRLPLSVLRPPRLVGREDAWARMEEAWGRGQIIHLLGDPGQGKSRLALDFAHAHGRVLSMNGRPGDGPVPYIGSARNIRQILRLHPDLPLEPWVRASLAPLVPELAPAGTDAPTQPAPLTTPLLAAIQHVFELGLREVETFIVDDMHCSDPATLEAGYVLFSSVFPLGQPGGIPRLITCSRRGELSPEGEAMIEGQVAAGVAIRIELEPLGEEAVGALVGSLEVPELGPRLDDLRAFTGGNPQWLLETVRHLIETGGAGNRRLPLPPGVHEVLAQRVGRLSKSALQAARAAAVLQQDFTLELVAEVLHAPLLDVAESWAELEAAQIVEGERFSHDLVLEGILATIPESVRGLLHRASARTLVRHHGQPARVARHWLEGGDLAHAASWFVRAAEQAGDNQRPHEAEGFYTQAADLFARLGQDEQARALHARRGETRDEVVR